MRAGDAGRARVLGLAVGAGVAAWLLGIGAPLLAAVIWGAVVAPKARWRLPRPVRVVVELGLFGVGQAPWRSPGGRCSRWS